MERELKYEVVFGISLVVYYFLATIGALFMIFELSTPYNTLLSIYIYIGFTIINLIKLVLLRTNNINSDNLALYVEKIIELIVLLVITKVGIMSLWGYIGLVIILLSIVSLSNNIRNILVISIGVSILDILFSVVFLHNGEHVLLRSMTRLNVIFFDMMFGAATIIISGLSGMIFKENYETKNKNKLLVAEIEEKYDMLALAQQEIKNHYDKLKYTNKKLEETNLKLSRNVGEFYTLHQISNAISSILDIKELLRYVNDVLIGVMGVHYSTIATYDEVKERLKINTTNITDSEELYRLTTNINSSPFLETLQTGKPAVNNNANNSSFPFAEGRDISSFICMPLIIKERKLGIVLVEHKHDNAFSDDQKRLMDIICQQVSIAMENAVLYQRMHELAIRDWLTGVYNRVYFQQIISTEINKAKEEAYELCISIFDIDNFKRFNDTYGHVFGDQVIKSVAQVVGSLMEPTDIIARYGGEEFAILMPNTNIDEAYKRLETIRSELENSRITDGDVSVSATASFGVAGYPNSATSEKDLLKNADLALYDAKNNGKNCVRVYC